MATCDAHETMAREITTVHILLRDHVLPGIDELKLAIRGRPDRPQTGLQARLASVEHQATEIEQNFSRAQAATLERVEEVISILRGSPQDEGQGGLVGRVTRLETLISRYKALGVGLVLGAGVAGVGIRELIGLVL